MKKHILSNENPPILNDFLNYLVAHEDEVQDLLDRLDKVMM